ncbi:Imm7 family immunity protein [Sphingomonas sp. RT2P30]|uniref:Imm7 family immunity protein n=1 Tax=Parasphingomonas halimpatiens TaxID=3096162 RepID=UPI002FC5BAE3
MFECFIWLMVSDQRWPHWKPWSELGLSEEEMEKFEIEQDLLDESKFERLSDKLRRACDEGGLNFDLFNLHSTYGGIAATAGYGRNHAWSAGTLETFLRAVSTLAPATYGVVYALDSDRDDVAGEFDVWKLAHQKVTRTTDLLVP